MKNAYLLICILLISNFGFSQTSQITPDSIDVLINQHSGSGSSYDENISFYKEIDSLSRSINYNEGLFHSGVGYVLIEREHSVNNVSEKILVLDSLYELKPRVLDDTLVVLYFLAKGRNYSDRNDPLNELDNYFMADSISSAAENEFLMCTVNYYFAEYYQRNKQIEKALEYDRKVSLYYRDMEESSFQKKIYLQSLLNIGVLHYKLEAYDSAIFYTNQCLDGGFDAFENSYDPYVLMGRSLFAQGDFFKAEEFANHANDELKEKTYYSRGRFETQLLLGKIKTEVDNLDEAYNHLDSARQIADSMQYISSTGTVNKALFYWGVKEYKCEELKQYFENYTEIKEKRFDQEVATKEKQLLVQFETAKKEKKILELTKVHQKEKTRSLYIVFSLIILLLVTVLIIYLSFVRRKMLRQKLTNSELEKEIAHSKLKFAINNLKEKMSTINELKIKLSSNASTGLSFERITNILGESYIDETQWNEVIYHFDELNDNFTKKLIKKHDGIVKSELKLLVLIHMGFLNKEIAHIKGVSLDGVKKAKQRLKSKLGIRNFSEL
ncbi:MAG: tetratricopeptide (TPR) repeat protein [Crocinitomix sp.]|jgi:tetratricopeptide (TPR) repeat protein